MNDFERKIEELSQVPNIPPTISDYSINIPLFLLLGKRNKTNHKQHKNCSNKGTILSSAPFC